MLYVGGSFSSAGGKNTNNIAMYDGESWHYLGSNSSVNGLTGSLNNIYALAMKGSSEL